MPVGSWDIVVALHACDTATDDALALAVMSGAGLIFAAPCCHQELRAAMRSGGGLEAILRQGILEERFAEILTDGLRALVLESRGYRSSVIEFVPAEHSGKNLLILAQAPAEGLKPDPTKLEQALAIAQRFGLERIYLESLLGLEDLSDLSPPWRKLGAVAKELRT